MSRNTATTSDGQAQFPDDEGEGGGVDDETPAQDDIEVTVGEAAGAAAAASQVYEYEFEQNLPEPPFTRSLAGSSPPWSLSDPVLTVNRNVNADAPGDAGRPPRPPADVIRPPSPAPFSTPPPSRFHQANRRYPSRGYLTAAGAPTSYRSSASFRNLLAVGRSVSESNVPANDVGGANVTGKAFYEEVRRTVDFEYDFSRELDEDDVLVRAGRKTASPMAADNRRFFYDSSSSAKGSSSSVSSTSESGTSTTGSSGSTGAGGGGEPVGSGSPYGAALRGLQEKLLREEREQETGQRKVIGDFESNGSTEVTSTVGRLWRYLLRLVLIWTNDLVNRLRFGRGGLEDFLPFMAWHESYATGTVLMAFDLPKEEEDVWSSTSSSSSSSYRCCRRNGGTSSSKASDWDSLRLAFRNRNATRSIAQTLGARYDWLYHRYTQVSRSRLFDFCAQFPAMGFLAFPATENFPSSKVHAIRSFLRGIREGSFLTRLVTCGFQGLEATDENAYAQNLAAEATEYERANINQEGTYYGRQATNEFRREHRLPTDESVVRTFATSPFSTMVNNGVEHVLRCLAKHWKNMLFQLNGNFAHQRMEQLNPL